MKCGGLVLAVVVIWLVPGISRATDHVKLVGVTRAIDGTISEVSRTRIVIDEARGGTREIPVNEIAYIVLSDEPGGLSDARRLIASEKYEEALATLEKLKDESLSKEVLQEIDFYRGMSLARLALSGAEGASSDQARESLIQFAKDYPKSYHYFAVCEMVGDLLVSAGDYGTAAKVYRKLTEAPWPDYKMRAEVAVGRALIAEGKPTEALQAFESVLAMEVDPKDEAAQTQHDAALVGKARCLAEAGKTDEAIKMAQDIIAKTSSENAEVHARAYVALGVAYKNAHRTKDALMAFLHVDVLYNNVPDAHAEALTNLVDLWTALRRVDRAEQARQVLRDRYHGGAKPAK